MRVSTEALFPAKQPMPNFRPPAFAYPGGKARLANRLVGMLPINAKRYVDVFAGRGNVFFAAAGLHYDKYWLNDPDTARFFRSLRDWDQEISIPEFPTRLWFDHYKKQFDEEQSLASVLLEPYLTYSGGGYHRGSSGSNGGVTMSGYERSLRKARQILRQVDPLITDWDWKRVFEELTADDIAFLDPPYIDAVKDDYYRHLMHDHEKMVKMLANSKFRWLLTEYRNGLYVRELGQPFVEIEVPLCMDKSENVVGFGRQYRTECIWKNY